MSYEFYIGGKAVEPTNFRTTHSYGKTDVAMEFRSPLSVRVGERILVFTGGVALADGIISAIEVDYGGKTIVEASMTSIPSSPTFRYGDIVRDKISNPTDRQMVMTVRDQRVDTIILDDNDGKFGEVVTLFADQLVPA